MSDQGPVSISLGVLSRFVDLIRANKNAAHLAVGIVAVYLYYRHEHAYFERRGVKTPQAKWPVIGNMWPLVTKARKDVEEKWFAECGNLYGVYLGAKPWLVVADADVLRQISIKDFHIFPNHDSNNLLAPYQKAFLIATKDEHWKKLRAMQSPTFTSSKIKRMFRLLDACADDLVEYFKEKVEADNVQGKDVKIAELFYLYTMDGIATCAYGLKLMREKNDDMKTMAARNEFISAGLKLFENYPVRLALAQIIPEPLLQFFGFQIIPQSAFTSIARQSRQVINARYSSDKRHDDYLQLLLDAKFKDKLELNEMDAAEDHHAGLTKESMLNDQSRLEDDVELHAKIRHKKIELDDIEILSSTIFLLAVGLETTAASLTLTTYALAFHQDVQDRLHNEIALIAESDATSTKYVFDYDKLTSCAYLDAVVLESLRCMPPVVALDRVAKQDYTIEKYNIKLDKSTKIFLSFYAIMHNPEYWPEPYKYDPNRFMPENREKIVPGSYCPFGLGPRHCLGMRFSLTETKIALAKLIMNFRFEPIPGSEFPPASVNHNNMYNAKHSNVLVIRR